MCVFVYRQYILRRSHDAYCVVVAQALAYARQVMLDRNSEGRKPCSRPDTRELQNSWSVDRAGTQDHFPACV